MRDLSHSLARARVSHHPELFQAALQYGPPEHPGLASDPALPWLRDWSEQELGCALDHPALLKLVDRLARYRGEAEEAVLGLTLAEAVDDLKEPSGKCPAEAVPELPQDDAVAGVSEPSGEGPPAVSPEQKALLAYLKLYTNGIAKERIQSAFHILTDDSLSANEKLTRMDNKCPFPIYSSAEQLGALLGVTKQAVLKTEWWRLTFKDRKQIAISRRKERHAERAKGYESTSDDDD
ncbi:MAG: hypothetical protein U0840_08550 [Gemmataceae bacterium]